MDVYVLGKKKSCCSQLMFVNIQRIKTGNNSTNKREFPLHYAAVGLGMRLPAKSIGYVSYF